jgi:hypothetical protein
MAQGNNGFGKVLLLYCLMGGMVVLLRVVVLHTTRMPSPKIPSYHFTQPSEQEPTFIQRVIPFLPLFGYFVLSWIFMPPSPWRGLTSTLACDVTTAVSSVFIHQAFHSGPTLCSGDTSSTRIGTHPFGTLRYNPAYDPYYITNLDQPLDPFIGSALEGVKFTNIVHIVLESMREDSFPYDENGLLHQHILKNEKPVKGGTPITSENLTPFIISLAENTLSWHTMWSTIPYTHKAMLGCTSSLLLIPVTYLTVDWCGEIPAPVDWTQEFTPPASGYQHCFPQVLRYLNSLSSTENEIMDSYKNKSRPTTDKWETVHVHSSTGTWDWGREVIKESGFDAIILAEEIYQLNGGKEYPSTFGYFDDGPLRNPLRYSHQSFPFARNRGY